MCSTPTTRRRRITGPRARSNGVMECWVLPEPITPSLHYSITPCPGPGNAGGSRRDRLPEVSHATIFRRSAVGGSLPGGALPLLAGGLHRPECVLVAQREGDRPGLRRQASALQC